MPSSYLRPNYLLPGNVECVFSTRIGGYSKGAYDSFNLGSHVDDAAGQVARNRQKLVEDLQLPAVPLWLNQIHSAKVINSQAWIEGVEADALWTQQAGHVCAVLTADCLPVVFVAANGDRVGVAHAGWRGLAAGILENTLLAMQLDPGDTIACFGPAIGPSCFEVQADVVAAFDGLDNPAFTAKSATHWDADIFLLAEQRLRRAGVSRFAKTNWCTYSDQQQFFSYRRDGQTGRMASLVWKKNIA